MHHHTNCITVGVGVVHMHTARCFKPRVAVSDCAPAHRAQAAKALPHPARRATLLHSSKAPQRTSCTPRSPSPGWMGSHSRNRGSGCGSASATVSYTHLTLPTNREV
eukprot:4788594-Heterocapsa_arctica.AAC.1